MREKSNPVTAGFWLIKKKIPWKSLPVFGPECPTAVLTKVLARMNIVMNRHGKDRFYLSSGGGSAN
jgi:hypothetical protein